MKVSQIHAAEMELQLTKSRLQDASHPERNITPFDTMMRNLQLANYHLDKALSHLQHDSHA